MSFNGKRNDRTWAYKFYASSKWRRCRNDYLASKGSLCERCLANGRIIPADEVHHKIRLTSQNINDPNVSLNWSNLEALCEECHRLEHSVTEWRTDQNGHVLDLE